MLAGDTCAREAKYGVGSTRSFVDALAGWRKESSKGGMGRDVVGSLDNASDPIMCEQVCLCSEVRQERKAKDSHSDNLTLRCGLDVLKTMR